MMNIQYPLHYVLTASRLGARNCISPIKNLVTIIPVCVCVFVYV